MIYQADGGSDLSVLTAIGGLNFVFTKKWIIPMNHQKSVAEQFAENRKWLETEWKKVGLEEANKIAGDVPRQTDKRLATNHMLVAKERPQQRG